MIIKIPDEYNARDFSIGIDDGSVFEADGKYVKYFSREKIEDEELDVILEKLWKEKYGQNYVYKGECFNWADQLGAGYYLEEIQYPLTLEEKQAILDINKGGTNLSLEMAWVFTHGFKWKPGMAIHEGVIPTQEEIQTLFQWPPEYDDNEGWLEIAFVYLFEQVIGKQKIDIHFPIKYNLGERCNQCKKPRKFIVKDFYKCEFKCGCKPEKETKRFPKYLKQIRLEKKTSRKMLAKVLNASQKEYLFFESGEKEPTIEELILLAKYFGITVNELLGYPKSEKDRKIKIEIAKELYENTEVFRLKDLIDDYIINRNRYIETQISKGNRKKHEQLITLDQCIHYINKEKFDIRGWQLLEIFKDYSYAFYNFRTGKKFELTVSENGNVIPRYISKGNEEDAKSIQEAIEKYDWQEE